MSQLPRRLTDEEFKASILKRIELLPKHKSNPFEMERPGLKHCKVCRVRSDCRVMANDDLCVMCWENRSYPRRGGAMTITQFGRA